MDCDRLAKETKEECARQLAKETDPVKRFRLRALMRGLDKIRAIGKSFKIMDDDGNRGLSMEEFVHGCEDWGITMPRAEIEQVFHTFNKDQNPGEAVLLNFNEFLDAVRPPMTKPRLDLVNKVFDHLNRTSPNYEQRKALEKEGKVGLGSGQPDDYITVEDLALRYRVDDHPLIKNGEMSQKDVLQQFLDTFQPGSKNKDDKVTRDEFIDYYRAVSVSIDTDASFSFIINRAWGINPSG